MKAKIVLTDVVVLFFAFFILSCNENDEFNSEKIPRKTADFEVVIL